jgi:hypothetical protein
MCSKRKYDKIGAMLAIAKIQNKGNYNRHECRYYFCNKCKAYHLTSQEKKKQND